MTTSRPARARKAPDNLKDYIVYQTVHMIDTVSCKFANMCLKQKQFHVVEFKLKV